MGLYDIPAMIDYILKRTGFRDLHLLGHSMASSAMLVTLSERPRYNAKVRLASWMSPSIRMRGFIRRAFDAVFSRFRNRVDVSRVYSIAALFALHIHCQEKSFSKRHFREKRVSEDSIFNDSLRLSF